MIKDSIEECLPHKDPAERPDYTEREIQSIRAVYNGTADERQQRTALDFLIRACGTHDQSYREHSDRDTVFAEGKRFIGLTLIWMIKAAPTRTDPDKISTRRTSDERGSSRQPDQ